LLEQFLWSLLTGKNALHNVTKYGLGYILGHFCWRLAILPQKHLVTPVVVAVYLSDSVA
jgi:hypothetical protein